MKRPIAATSAAAPPSSHFVPSTAGLLFPYLKHILFALHLIYEECKLYRSLDAHCQPLIHVQYLIANELNLPLYTTYYESEYPLLLKLKSNKVFASSTSSNTATTGQSSASFSNVLNFKSTSNYLTSVMSQEPPVLYKFLTKLIEEPVIAAAAKASGSGDEQPSSPSFFLNSISMDMSAMNQAEGGSSDIINPFPVIGSVTKRIIKTIKIYALIALSTRKSLKNIGFNELLNQLLFKVNLSG